MNKLFFLSVIVFFTISFNGCYAKENSSWSDYLQDSIQVKSPVEYMDVYNNYAVVNPNLKIKLTNFGNIDKTKKNINYTLKKYGVQVLNGKDGRVKLEVRHKPPN